MLQVERQSSGSCTPSPRTPADRGWSLDFSPAGRLGAMLMGAVLIAVLAPATTFAAAYDPETDPTSMASITADTGATLWWDAGYTGRGVDIALIDTGVSPVEGLAASGQIIYGPDLSLESQQPDLTNLDTNGHGTFMAGLIAGRDPAMAAPYSSASASLYRGMAPDARIVSLKVAVADGGTDVSQVIAAVDWVVQHRNDNGLNIRVINLSYGTNSLQPSTVDPLSFAVEQAWKAGIVVVAAAGNTGYQIGAGAPGLADPAYNRFVIAVGGFDTMGTADVLDDHMGSYSASGGACGLPCKPPDFSAAGSHLQGLRVPNGYVDMKYPGGLLGSRYLRGSGTSEATAIASGSIALLLQKYPELRPNQVKTFIKEWGLRPTTANEWTRKSAGAGEINLTAMAAAVPLSCCRQFWPAGTGTGTLEAARGTDHLSIDGVLLSGEQDIFGQVFDSAAMAGLEAQGNSWSGGTWNGNSWSGNSWSGSSWSGNSWSGSSWSGNSWSGSSWSGNSWSGSSWSGNSWSGNSWSGSSWSGNSWSGGPWD